MAINRVTRTKRGDIRKSVDFVYVYFPHGNYKRIWIGLAIGVIIFILILIVCLSIFPSVLEKKFSYYRIVAPSLIVVKKTNQSQAKRLIFNGVNVDKLNATITSLISYNLSVSSKVVNTFSFYPDPRNISESFSLDATITTLQEITLDDVLEFANNMKVKIQSNEQLIQATLPKNYVALINVSAISFPVPAPKPPLPEPFSKLSFIAIGDDNGIMQLYKVGQFNQNTKSFEAHSNAVNRIKQLPFHGYVATCSSDKTVKIWDPINNWNLVQTYRGHKEPVNGLEYINANIMVSGSDDETLQIWSISKGQTLRVINVTKSVWSLKILSNGIYLACGLSNGQIHIYNINDGSSVAILEGHVSKVNDLELTSNGNLLASSSSDKTVRIWDLKTYANVFNLMGHNDQVFGLKLISSGILASGSWDATVKLWNITSGTLLRTLSGHSSKIYWAIDFLSDGVYTNLITGSMDQKLILWDIDSGEKQSSSPIYIAQSIKSLTVLRI